MAAPRSAPESRQSRAVSAQPLAAHNAPAGGSDAAEASRPVGLCSSTGGCLLLARLTKASSAYAVRMTRRPIVPGLRLRLTNSWERGAAGAPASTNNLCRPRAADASVLGGWRQPEPAGVTNPTHYLPAARPHPSRWRSQSIDLRQLLGSLKARCGSKNMSHGNDMSTN